MRDALDGISQLANKTGQALAVGPVRMEAAVARLRDIELRCAELLSDTLTRC